MFIYLVVDQIDFIRFIAINIDENRSVVLGILPTLNQYDSNNQIKWYLSDLEFGEHGGGLCFGCSGLLARQFYSIGCCLILADFFVIFGRPGDWQYIQNVAPTTKPSGSSPI